MKIGYVCYLSAALNSEEDLRRALAAAAGDLNPRGIYRLDLEIPAEVDSNLVRLIFRGLAVDHNRDPNDYVFAIYKEAERAVEELYIRLDQACAAAIDAGMAPSDVYAALVEMSVQANKERNNKEAL